MDQRNQPHGVDPLRAKRMKIEEPFDTKILPNEVWLEIFSYLSAYDVVNSLAKVCNHFNLLTQDLELIRKVLTKGCCINNLLHFLNLPLDGEGLKELTGIEHRIGLVLNTNPILSDSGVALKFEFCMLKNTSQADF